MGLRIMGLIEQDLSHRVLEKQSYYSLYYVFWHDVRSERPELSGRQVTNLVVNL